MGTQDDTTKITLTKASARGKGIIGSNAETVEEPAQNPLGQRKRPESRFCLQVDRQTKASYATYETAEQAALAIKKGHPIVRVVVYDTVECVNKVIEVPK
jgi:hypothetical protein